MNFNKYNDNYNITGKRLKQYWEKLNIFQEQLSNQLLLLGITLYQSDIFKIENNEKTVRDFKVWGITGILNITCEELFAPYDK